MRRKTEILVLAVVWVLMTVAVVHLFRAYPDLMIPCSVGAAVAYLIIDLLFIRREVV